MKRKARFGVLIGLVATVVIVVGVLVWPTPKKALAWPTYVTVSLTDLDQVPPPVINGATIHVVWWDAGFEIVGDQFDLVHVSGGVYITSSFEDEPPEEAVWCHVTIQDGGGFVPEDPNAWDQTELIEWSGNNAFNWEMEPE